VTTSLVVFSLLGFPSAVENSGDSMKRFANWLLLTILLLAVAIVVAINLTIGWRPFVGPKTRPLTGRTFERTPQRLVRGGYIAEASSGCMYCHSPHDWNAPGDPLVPGMTGAGEPLPYANLPGRIVAPNLTPDPETGAGTWTDDQFARAIREGIGHDGRTLFPLMPYTHYRSMSDEDLASVVVYLRSLAPVRNSLPATEIISPVKYLIRSVPEPVTAAVPDIPATASPVTRGAYLVNIAGCSDCHTPQDRGQYIQALAFAGGFPFPGPWGDVSSANITPDPSGIPYYDEALFLQVIRTGSVQARKLSSVMPVQVYRNLSDDDLKSMFAYLRTLKPVRHRVDNTEPPTYCKLCRTRHGAGDRN
jgi:mono/diheme cytochrome c family protein